jgi:hypothetical protein
VPAGRILGIVDSGYVPSFPQLWKKLWKTIGSQWSSWPDGPFLLVFARGERAYVP